MDCPSCGSLVPDAEIRKNLRLARCPRCEVSIDVRVDGDAVRALEYRDPIIEHLVIELDEPPTRPGDYRSAMQVGGRFRACNGWRSKSLSGLLFFTLFWNGFMAVWFTISIWSGWFWLAAAGMLHLGVGLWLVWHGLSAWFNHSLIEIREGRLSCVHGPLPVWFDKAKPVELAEVEMFVPELVSTTSTSKQSESPSALWRIDARLKRGGSVTVVTRLQDEPRARILARMLETHLERAD